MREQMLEEIARIAQVRSHLPSAKELAAKYHRTPRTIQELLRQAIRRARIAHYEVREGEHPCEDSPVSVCEMARDP